MLPKLATVAKAVAALAGGLATALADGELSVVEALVVVAAVAAVWAVPNADTPVDEPV